MKIDTKFVIQMLAMQVAFFIYGGIALAVVLFSKIVTDLGAFSIVILLIALSAIIIVVRKKKIPRLGAIAFTIFSLISIVMGASVSLIIILEWWTLCVYLDVTEACMDLMINWITLLEKAGIA